MGYLQRLILEKEAKEKFDRDVDRMKVAKIYEKVFYNESFNQF